MPHPALSPGRVAVITGAAGGIGLAVAQALAGRGLKLVLADREEAALARALASLPAEAEAASLALDVAEPGDLQRLADLAYDHFGAVHLLMNNAGVGANPGKPWEELDGWRSLLDVNLWGAINGVQAFVPRMLAGGEAGLVVNTGSKQGITLPPGNSAYNVSKAALKAYTELLAHELREAADGRISAHLLIPGWTFTGMTRGGATEKPDGAWSGAQVADFMLAGIERGEFYLLCPDNDTPRRLDERRMAWSAADIVENRPALSRWTPEYAQAFKAFVAAD